MTFWKNKSSGDSKKSIQWLPEVGEEGGEKRKSTEFLGLWKYFGAIMVGTHHYMFVKTHMMSNIKSYLYPNVNYGLWVIRMCQCRLISCSKYTTLVWDIDSGGIYACMGVGSIWELLPLSFFFFFGLAMWHMDLSSPIRVQTCVRYIGSAEF